PIITLHNGMIHSEIKHLAVRSVSNIIQTGGTILKSARSMEFMTKEGRQKAFENLKKHEIEGLIAIGGNGTFTGAKIFHEEYGIPTVGAPGTIDNDLYGTDYTIGYDTAVNTALDAIDKIRDTASSHDRVFFIEVMGRDSGYIAIYTGIGGGAELILVPETETSIEDVKNTLQKSWDKKKSSSIIVVAEGDELGNANDVAEKVKNVMPKFDFRVTNLGHVQRGGTPTAADRVLASRLGLGALEGLISGKTNVMAGVVNNKLVYTDFDDAINKSKPINPELLRLNTILSI
ncbi:MAG: ATP-dependent 6-phosphofructokinase, partial [Cytophagales bacterium]